MSFDLELTSLKSENSHSESKGLNKILNEENNVSSGYKMK